MAMAMCGRTLSAKSIIRNVIYSFMLFLTCVFCSIGLATYQWMETTAEHMEESGIKIPPEVPGLNSVSCGLFSYCLDAAGEVSECSLPWPRYGDKPEDVPSTMWKGAAGCILLGLIMQVLCFLYSLMACFGCFHDGIQRWSTKIATTGGLFMLLGLLIWGGSFGDYSVEECYGGAEKINGECAEWQPVLPSAKSQADAATDIGCRICNYKMGPFMPDENCSVGFGAILVAVACVLAIFSGCAGEGITSKQKAYEEENRARGGNNHQFTTKAGRKVSLP